MATELGGPMSHKAGQLGEGQLCDALPPPVLLSWEQAQVPALQEEYPLHLALGAGSQ